ncbi:condensation domain-containing protein, partial [Virgisporangium aurantiacum]|uniref:condensation domain-containing protein n=1 Tax=Virgisporangium aurantiacum TaxID=175570 RepID=UPI00195031D1
MTGTLGTIVDAYPLTAMQAGMVFHNSYAPDIATYHDLFTLTLRGPYDADALRAALDEVVAGHPVLRTSFEIADLSEPLQLVHAAVRVPFVETDLSAGGVDAARTRLRAWRDEEKRRPFDLGTPPLLRVFAHRLSATDFAVALSFHHAILDGWSTAALMTELLRRYSARLAGDPLPVAPPPLRFRDAVAAERRTVASGAAVTYWRTLVADAEPIRLPRLPGYPSGDSENVENVGGPIAPDVFAGLERLARDLRVPLRTVLLTGHLRVMGLFGGADDVTTGIVTHSRPEHSRGSEVLGMFLNAVPVRADLDAETWRALVRRVFDGELAMLPHRLFPLAELQRVTGRSNLFEAIFDYRDFYVYRGLDEVRGVEVVDYDYFDQTNIPLAVGVVRAGDDGRPRVHLVYARDQFPRSLMTALRDAYVRVYTELATDPDADPRRTAPLLGPDAARIASWQGRTTTYPTRLTSASPDDDAPAVVSDDETVLSHADFAARAAGLAGRLVELGVGVGAPVGISLPRGVDLLVAVQAVLRAGGAFVSLDPDLPDERLRGMARQAGVDVVVSDNAPLWTDRVVVRADESAVAV